MYNKEDIRNIVTKINDIVNEHAQELSEIDGKSGDGDLGASMQAAFSALKEYLDNDETTDIGMSLMKASMACNKAAPSTMGTLVSSGIMAMAKAYKGKSELSDEDVARIPELFFNAIKERGKAEVGDKTILDALHPMYNAVNEEFAASGDLLSAYKKGAEAAKEGAENTAGMVAKMGRARWIGERSQENMDAGAYMLSLLMNELVK